MVKWFRWFIKSLVAEWSPPGGDDLPAWLLPYSSSQSPPCRGPLYPTKAISRGGIFVPVYFKHTNVGHAFIGFSIGKLVLFNFFRLLQNMVPVDCRHYSEASTTLLVDGANDECMNIEY